MLIWIHLSHCFQRLRDNIFFPLNWFSFSFAQTLTFSPCPCPLPFPCKFFMVSSAWVCNWESESDAMQFFLQQTEKRGWYILHGVGKLSTSLFTLLWGIRRDWWGQSFWGYGSSASKAGGQLLPGQLMSHHSWESWKRKARFHHPRPLPPLML